MHSPVRPRGRYELKRQYFHRGYLWPWILVIIVPFVLRFVMFYDISFPFQSSPSSTPVVVRPKELVELYKMARDRLGSSPPAPVIRPNKDTWITHDNWINDHAKGPMAKTEIQMSKDGRMKRTEIETSKGHDHTLTMRPNKQDFKDGSFVLPEQHEDIIKVAGVAESQLRAIGERINVIKRFHGQKDNAEEMREMSRLKNGVVQRKAEKQERANDDQSRISISGQGLNKKQTVEAEAEKNAAEKEERAAEDRKAAAEADEDRMFAEELETDEQMMIAEEEANDQRRPAEETEAEERRFGKELETTEESEEAAKERKVAKQIEVDEERRVAENMEADEERAAEGREAEEEMIAAKEREADEHGKAGEEREAVEERKAAHEKEANEVRKAAQKREFDDEKEPTQEKMATQEKNSEIESKADEQGEAGEKKAAQERQAAEQRKTAQGQQAADEGMKVDQQGETAGQMETEEGKSASDKTEADETNDEGQKQSQQRDVEVKNFNEDEQKVANNHKEDGDFKSDQSTEESKSIEDHNAVEEKEKEEEKHEESDPNYGENVSSSNDETEGESLAARECDLFDGDWEFDPEGPMYTNSTCFFIRGDHNCMSNGRPDTGYQNWRWKPRGCDLPRFDARAFMEAHRGKTIGYVGDSLARNQMQSMLCLLSLVEIPILVHEDALTARWYYEQHKVTLAAVWSPYLLKESQEGILGFEKGQSVLYLDVLDPVWTSALPHLDIVVFSVGQWYYKPSVYVMQDEIIGCHYCPKLNLTEIGFYQAYSEGLRSALEKVGTGDWKGTAIISTFAIAHGERGSGEEGDQCRRERPLEKEEFESSFQGIHDEMRDVFLAEFNSMMVNDESKLNNSEAHMHFLDVTKLSLLRADGHPGPFYLANPFEGKDPGELVFNDCLHWCLPGPVDTWNQLLVKIMHKQL